ncbi:hypothetical protein B0H17DRAFT_1195166 [Mycena rosella]|uniref:Uncharacterized protein n=1 Tax=Mycena rosella TaxID=1033263 RepID=A0AAD7DXA6_MYCRO|nr:hypothetical protein B0H17DRAFT_1195166 [Mycena rosella]
MSRTSSTTTFPATSTTPPTASVVPGVSTAFFNRGNKNIVRELVELLRKAQEIPPWLETVANEALEASFGGSFRARSGRGAVAAEEAPLTAAGRRRTAAVEDWAEDTEAAPAAGHGGKSTGHDSHPNSYDFPFYAAPILVPTRIPFSLCPTASTE